MLQLGGLANIVQYFCTSAEFQSGIYLTFPPYQYLAHLQSTEGNQATSKA